VLACPYAPDLSDRTFAGAEAFGRFVTAALLPKARERAGAPASPARTGLDGVSMGGRLALWIGAEERDVPRPGRRRVAHDGDAVEGHELDGHAEPPAQLLGQVDRHAARLPGRPVLPGENEVAVVDPGAEGPGRGEVGANGGCDVGHGARC
jgi:hypothetical protein